MIAREARERLVEHLRRRGVRDERVLEAIGRVRREDFLPARLAEFAYEDVPLPIEESQTISQPLVVALMAEAARIRPEDRVLEVGTGSGYAAAVLACLCREVYSVERHESLASTAAERLGRLGFENVHVLHGDGTLGWPEHAPYDAVVVAAGGPEVPRPLIDQLGPHGRIVIPVGSAPRDQELVRLVRTNGQVVREDLGGVRFVPLIGRRGWQGEEGGRPLREPEAPPSPPAPAPAAALLMREVAEPFHEIDDAELGSLLERVGDARVILLGEATHGTSEFYRMRARITRDLIADHGVRIVAIEGDWPDVHRVDRWVQGAPEERTWTPFTRFPTWMWRNRETEAFVAWLRAWNETRAPEERAGFFGLDLYSMFRSLDAVVTYLDRVDPEAARVARERYGCLAPWQHDPAAYGRAALTGAWQRCEDEAVAILQDLLRGELDYAARDGDRFLDAVQNARLVAGAETYYRIMYRGGHAAWNHRDRHMFSTLERLLDWYGEGARAVVWAHNSHVGDHMATELGGQGQVTLGGLARDALGGGAYLVGFGTDHGTVMAAHDWGDPGQVMDLRPARPDSYEGLAHQAGLPAALLHLRDPVRDAVTDEWAVPRLVRAVGVVYRPRTELQSHYIQAALSEQFDSWIWFDASEAVRAIPLPPREGFADTYPFGL